MTLPCPTEAEEARTLVAWLRVKGYKFTHIPTETGSTPEARHRAIRMKQQGTTRGFPDYLVICGGNLVAIELKRVRGGRVSPEQKDWIAALNAANVPAVVCNGSGEAIEFLEQFDRTQTITGVEF